MVPDFSIIANGNNITNLIKDRFISLSVTDEAGIESDKIDLRLDDRDQKFELPKTGVPLEVTLGYQGNLIKQGTYIVDEIGIENPPRTLSIQAKAANMARKLKEPKTRSFEKITIGDLVKVIATEHGLIPATASEKAGFELTNLSQTNESDLNLLTRIAIEHDCVAKPSNGKLIFAPHAEVKTVSGQQLPIINLKANDLTSWQYRAADRGKYESVTAKYYDDQTAESHKVTVGTGIPVFTLNKQFKDKASAWAAANAKFNALKRGTATITLSLAGRADLMAEGAINLNGLRAGVDGTFIVNRTSHSLDKNGFTTRIDAEVKS